MIGLALTPEQFKVLLKMVYIANTVANGLREDEKYLKEYDELEQYFFSRAGTAGFPAAVWKHVAPGGDEHHHPSPVFEGDPELSAILDEYDERIAKEFLAEKLAERDISETFGPDAKAKLGTEAYDDLVEEYAERYVDEFDARGVARITIEGLLPKKEG